MTVDQLQDLIGGAVSLATAMAKPSGQAASPEDFSRAAKSVIGVMQHAKETASDSATQPRRKYILWVDDCPDNNIYDRAAFEAMGFSFTLALSTKEALQILSVERFAAIISDMGRQRGQEKVMCFSMHYEISVTRHRSSYIQVRTLRNTNGRQQSMGLKGAQTTPRSFSN